MSKIRLAIVGCGGMGHRHLSGLAELHQAARSPFELVGACDPVQANAESLADQAKEYFGNRPAVAGNLDEVAAAGIEAIDITTTPRHHHMIAGEALAHGWHLMIEKPLGLTVKTCNLIRQAGQTAGRIISVAENYRRDPINRLAKALLQAGVIGNPRLMLHQVIGGGNRMLISVWRHQKDQSGVLLDVGVHYADMMEFLLGEIETVYAQTRLHEPVRHNPVAGDESASISSSPVYTRWQRQMPAEFEATAEDAAYATLTFKNGAVAQYIEDHAGHGQRVWTREIYGSAGSMTLPRDRSGQPITLQLANGDQIDDARLLEMVPDFHLDDVTATLFGGDRLWGYEQPFPDTDKKLIAVEYAEFGQAIAGKGDIEVDAYQGTRSVAISYAMLEASLLGRPVSVDALLSEQIDAYQRDINATLTFE